jgi:HSP20 family molecular chaperone IbpA
MNRNMPQGQPQQPDQMQQGRYAQQPQGSHSQPQDPHGPHAGGGVAPGSGFGPQPGPQAGPGQPYGERTRTRPVFSPAVDIFETQDAIILLAEMPGVDPQSVDITLERRVLAIRATVPQVQHAGYRQVYAEYSDGDYERVFTLSEDIDQERIEASVRDGVLQLVLPKAAPAQARKIPLRAG